RIQKEITIEEKPETIHARKSVVDRSKLETYRSFVTDSRFTGENIREAFLTLGDPTCTKRYDAATDDRAVPQGSEEFEKTYSEMKKAAIVKFVFESAREGHGLALYTDSNGTIVFTRQEQYKQGDWR
ncbi:MAG: hypothetical protein ABIH04_06870, partial [Planctomycetota bacterium]